MVSFKTLVDNLDSSTIVLPMTSSSSTKARSRVGWPEYALALAQTAATSRSEDPYIQVGACCLRHDMSVASVGYNGPPSGVDIDWSDRDRRRNKIVHAEINCLKYVRPGEGALLATTMMPCPACLTAIAAYKIPQVYYRDTLPRDTLESMSLASEFGITLAQLP